MKRTQYSKYKSSGIDWVPKIPVHWEVKKLKYVIDYNKHSLREDTDPDYTFEYIDISSVDLVKGVVKTETMNFESAPSRARRIVQCGDTIISTVRTYLKAITTIDKEVNDLIVSTGFVVLTPREKMTSQYLSYYVQSQQFVESVVANSTGVSYPAINPTSLIELPIVFPDLTEQEGIVLFLSSKISELDNLIAEKERLLKLLDEKRSALITQAVTKGLDPNVKMKPSGIDWLGDIPKHWQVKRLKYVAKIQFSGVDKKTNEDEDEVLLCNYVDVYKNDFITSDIEFMKATASKNEINKFVVEKGDLLVTKDSETPDDIAIPALVTEQLHNTLCGYHLAQIKTNKNIISPNFLFRLFQAKNFNTQFTTSANGITRFGLGTDVFGNALVPIMSLHEQREIEEFITQSINALNELSNSITTAIMKLKEYRISLITSAVTGKIDVRDFKQEQENEKVR